VFSSALAIRDDFAEEPWDIGEPLLLNNTFLLTVISVLFKAAFVCFALRPQIVARQRIPINRPYYLNPEGWPRSIRLRFGTPNDSLSETSTLGLNSGLQSFRRFRILVISLRLMMLTERLMYELLNDHQDLLK